MTHLISSKGEDGEWTGLNLDIWKAVAQELKVNYVLKEMTFNQLLQQLEGGQYRPVHRWIFCYGGTRNVDALFLSLRQHPAGRGDVARKGPASLAGGNEDFFLLGNLQSSWGLLRHTLFLGFLFWLLERRSNSEHFGGGPLNGVGSGIYWVGSTLASGVCFGITLKSLSGKDPGFHLDVGLCPCSQCSYRFTLNRSH